MTRRSGAVSNAISRVRVLDRAAFAVVDVVVVVPHQDHRGAAPGAPGLGDGDEFGLLAFAGAGVGLMAGLWLILLPAIGLMNALVFPAKARFAIGT